MEIKLRNSLQVAIIDDEDFPLIGDYKWRLSGEGYAISFEYDLDDSPRSVFMHRLINATPPDGITDHIDRDRLNNRRRNLRTASRSVNSLNGDVPVTNRSGYRGVSWHSGKWRAAIVVNGRQENLGRYADPAAASAAYEARRQALIAA